MKTRFSQLCVVMISLILIMSLSGVLARGPDAAFSATGPPIDAVARPAADRAGNPDVWLDTIEVVEEPDAGTALDQMEAGDLDLYLASISDAALAARVEESALLDSYRTYGSFSELTFNPAGPVFDGTGKLNPFAVPRVREAMNWLVDRGHIAEGIYGGMATPRWHVLNTASADYVRLADVARGLELQYGYDLALAHDAIATEMQDLGATLVGGTWHYGGAPVEIILLIRIEDERLGVGDYVADQLEEIGFVTVRQYGSSGELSPIWLGSDPNDGLFHIYTGGWLTDPHPRDLGGNFAFFYTDMGLDFPLWHNYVNDPEFYEVCERLNYGDFETLDERHDLMVQAVELAMVDNVRMWLVDRNAINARRTEVVAAYDLYGGVPGSWLWPLTLDRGQVGGSMTLAAPDLFAEPWNPIAGSDMIYDMALVRATAELGAVPDPYTGLYWPQRLLSAEVLVQEGLPVGVTLDWVDLSFAPEITVPDDAWVDWDAAEQVFLTAGEVYPEPQTAQRRITVHYPADLFDTVTWHDGSPLSMGDFVLGMILTFDRAKEASAIYDPSAEDAFNSFMASFRGLRIISQDPLVIETYSDAYQLDAELDLTTWWPTYARGPGSWPAVTLGVMAEAAGEAAFSQQKADDLGVPRLNYVGEPTLAILADQLAVAVGNNTIPYTPTLGLFITEGEAAARWGQLDDWYTARAHFWVGTGPYYLEQADPGQGTATLQRNEAYPDTPDKWADFIGAPIPVVALDGPERVACTPAGGEEAVFAIEITLDGQPYPTADLAMVRYLLIDIDGRLAHTGEATPVDDGAWQVVLDGDLVCQLPAGPVHLEVIVTSRRVTVSSFADHPFLIAIVLPVAPGSGGTLVYTDTQGTTTSIVVPDDAVAGPVDLVYVPVRAVIPPSGWAFAGLGFDLDAYVEGILQPGFEFAVPVTVTIVYQDALVAGLSEGLLRLYFWDEDGEEWRDVITTCDPPSAYTRVPEENRLSVPICHLSRFGLFQSGHPIYLPVVTRG